VIVTLENQSRADAPEVVITDYTHIVDGPGPYRFRLDPLAGEPAQLRYFGLRNSRVKRSVLPVTVLRPTS